MPRLVVVSNRVAPITEGQPTSGGLAAGVMDALKQSGGIWFGWSGEITQDAVACDPTAQSLGSVELHTIDLTQRDYNEYYRGFSNDALWPVLHYRPNLARLSWGAFAGYRRVNTLFARSVAKLLQQNDLIWAHDYHLFPLAEALRAEGVNNRIGLFLHTPFPAPQIYMTIPSHAEIAAALCHYDLLGFQTETDRLAFEDYIVRSANGSAAQGIISAFGRTVKTGVYPIGVHVDEVRAQATDPTNQRAAAQLRASVAERKLIISVDRLDYSKGLQQRFATYEKFLETFPAAQNNVTFLQIAPPSRTDIHTYQKIREELEAEAGRINGRFAELDWVPLRYLNRGFPREVLMPLYAVAQVGLVTPLRDGMNLVAKEYLAAQDSDDPGVLVLSQFAGAAQELKAALVVNPYDSEGISQALDRAFNMPRDERRARHAELLRVMRHNSLDRWRDRFAADLMG
ncbi:MAG: alpha,alpha-trehalose-phosphate synthase (UDP-forming) [Acetobacteraceae bacterium]|nr:alpha,alpha-trehalose-phosphate synthase (UDP-forming) [Acetobacteraceae bacterium]